MNLTSIITVNYRQPEITADFLRSLSQYGGDTIEVIVVDNGTEEDREVHFKGIYPSLKYIRSEKNLGFAGGNNLGIQYATGDYLLLLNNDTEITEGFVDAMREELHKNPNIGLLSPLILYFDDKRKIQYAGYTPMDYLTGRNQGLGVMDNDNGQYDDLTTETGYCHGAAMMCRRADLNRVGLMAEHFFLYYEELDWCEQFKRAGFKLGFTGKAKIYHKESMSVGKESPLKAYFITRNRWLFIRRNTSWSTRFVFSCYYVFVATPYSIFKNLARARFDLAAATLRGIYWNITRQKNSSDLGIKLHNPGH